MTIFKLPQWGEKIAKKKRNRTLVWLLRVALGCTFMFSGLTKAIDPWGGFYKFAEYCNVYGFESLARRRLDCRLPWQPLSLCWACPCSRGRFAEVHQCCSSA